MSTPLSVFARPYLIDRQARATLDHAVLVLEKQPSGLMLGDDDDEEDTMPTSAGQGSQRAQLSEPLVFPVRKAGKAANAFLMGITIGRTQNNDVVVSDDSVSRFHAYFDRDPASDLWRLVDMGSLNGTHVGPLRLTPNQPHVCAARETLLIGKVPMLFFVPETFLAYVDSRI